MVIKLKHLPLLLTLWLILMLGIAQVRLVSAAGSVAFVRYQFSASEVYQGDSDIYVELEIGNNGDSNIMLHGASVTFQDWSGTGEYLIGSARSGELFDLKIALEPTKTYNLRIFFSVPVATSVGNHFFTFRVFHDSYNGSSWAYNQTSVFTPSSQFLNPWKVHDAYEKTYNTLRPTVEAKMTVAEGAGFISPEARALLQRANEALDAADSYAAEDQWDFALGQVQGARYNIELAYGAEQSFRNFLIIGAIAGVAAIVAIGLFVRRRKRRSSQSNANTEK